MGCSLEPTDNLLVCQVPFPQSDEQRFPLFLMLVEESVGTRLEFVKVDIINVFVGLERAEVVWWSPSLL